MPELNDLDFAGQLRDEASGHQAWLLTQPELEGRSLPTQRPRLDATRAASAALALWPEAQAEADLILACFDPTAERPAIQAALHRIPRLCHALHFVHAQLDLHDPERRSRPLLDEGADLKTRALYWAERAEALELLPPGQVAAIRAGTGFMDLARDLQALAFLLTPHTEALAALQLLQRTQQRRGPDLTPADLARMETVGTQLIALLSGDDLQRPWYTELIGVTTLLERDWTRLRNAWRYHRAKTGGEEPPSFFALGR